MAQEPRSFALAIDGIEGAALTVVGLDGSPSGDVVVDASPDAIESLRVFVRAPREALDGAATDVDFTLTNLETGSVSRHGSVFRGP